jgi:GSCFA family
MLVPLDTGRDSEVPERGPAWMYLADRSWVEEQMELAHGWLSDGALRRTPDTETMYEEGPEALLEGWLPAEPLIDPQTRVIAFGSCFATRFVEWLAEHGYNLAFDSYSDKSIVRSPLETPSVVAQQFRWAFGELDSDLAFWMTPDRDRVEATEEHRQVLRATLEQADVVIVTLGISELWYDSVSGEPIWRVPPRKLQDRYRFKVASLAESVGALDTIHRIRETYMPDLKIVYTVSPQRLGATFRGISPIVANNASKAILRAAVDEFIRAHSDELNVHYFYFPAYEIATEYLRDALFEDNVHIRDEHASLILELFARHYTTEPVSADGNNFPKSVEEELRRTIVSLDARTRKLQTICDERLAAIEHLDRELRAASAPSEESSSTEAELRQTIATLRATSDERTAAVAQLQAQIEALAAHARVLQTACDERLVVIRQLDADRRRPFAAARAAVRRLRRRPAGREAQPPA